MKSFHWRLMAVVVIAVVVVLVVAPHLFKIVGGAAEGRVLVWSPGGAPSSRAVSYGLLGDDFERRIHGLTGPVMPKLKNDCGGEHCHYMAWGRVDEDIPCPPKHSGSAASWHEMAQDLVRAYAVKAGKPFNIISVRILYTPAGTQSQTWHVDYGDQLAQSQGLLIALNDPVPTCGTELLEMDAGDMRALLDSAILAAAKKEPHKVVIEDFPHKIKAADVKKGEVVHVQLGDSLHRRGNCVAPSGYVRLTLNIDFTTRTNVKFVDTDFCESKGGLATGPMIDDLNTYVPYKREGRGG